MQAFEATEDINQTISRPITDLNDIDQDDLEKELEEILGIKEENKDDQKGAVIFTILPSKSWICSYHATKYNHLNQTFQTLWIYQKCPAMILASPHPGKRGCHGTIRTSFCYLDKLTFMSLKTQIKTHDQHLLQWY